MTFGPWAPDIDRMERIARPRSLRAIAVGFARRNHDLHAALKRAETLAPADLAEAYAAIEAAPSVARRKLLASFAELMR
jgi:hypothetical protein